MLISVLKSKIHRAVVTQADLNYIGSVTIDEALMEAAGLFENEKVLVVDLNNGNRLETYVIKGEKDSGIICLNGAAARLIHPKDLVIIMSFALIELSETGGHKPQIVFVDEKNRLDNVKDHEGSLTGYDV